MGEEAARRTVKKLGGRKIKSQALPIVVAREAGDNFIYSLFDAVSGQRIFRKASYLVGRTGQQLFSPLITLVDDATLVDSLSSRPFDAEGVKSSQVTLIQKGVLQNYVCDSYSARRLGLQPTGNAQRSYPVTGDVSRGALGFWIENGEITYPVQEITFAGNMLAMFKNIAMVGNDQNFKYGSAPTFLISEATIGGA